MSLEKVTERQSAESNFEQTPESANCCMTLVPLLSLTSAVHHR